MRNIRFRGKKKSDGKWLFGDLIHDNIGGCYIYPIDCENLYKENAVNPDTVGQFIELYDKHDDEIYEDDIIVWTIYKDIKYKGVVKCHQGGFVLEYMEGDGYYSFSNLSKVEDFEIIGNIHDNPELMDNNCEICIKGQKYNKKTDDWGKIKCSIQNDIFTQWFGGGCDAVLQKTYDATRQKDCPYKVTEYPKKKKDDKNQLDLFI